MPPKPSDTSKPSDKAAAGATAAKQWEALVTSMRDKAAAVDWSGVDWSTLNPRDIGVRVGPILTAEQFEEYRRTAGRPVQTIKVTPSDKGDGGS